MLKKNIYALCIAINEYTDGISKLHGCVNDMHDFRDYLDKQCKRDEFEFIVKSLENKKATRQGIIKGFKHFNAAQDGDICVLFFSGHGARVPTTDFWEATEELNEAIVCYDGCVVDKELSCLIYEATKDKPNLHFLAVMDCCHSGGNTRFSDDRATTRTRGCATDNYPLSILSYYGFDKNLYVRRNDGKYSAPKGKHIQFGACRSHELAKEKILGIKYRGTFTYSLIEALDTSFSALSYADLESRVRQKIDYYTTEQRPQVDAVANANVHQTFLGGAIAPKNRFFIAYNKVGQWELNAGLYHGINTNTKYPSVIQRADDVTQYFDIVEVKSDTSIGKWRSTSFVADEQKQYDAKVQIGGGQSHLVAFSSDCDPDRKAALKAQFDESDSNYIQLTDDIDQAAYFVHTEFKTLGPDDKLADYFRNAEGKVLWLRLKGEEKPLFFPIPSSQLDATVAAQFWQNANSVLQWFHLKSLENPLSHISKDIEITLYRKEGDKNWDSLTPNDMEKITNWQTPTEFNHKSGIIPCFALTIKNTGGRQLHVSALIMDGRFGIKNEYLPYERLVANGKTSLSETYDGQTYQSIGLTINDLAHQDGRTEQMDYVKIMVSTMPFETTSFVQESLDVRGTRHSTRSGDGTKDTVRAIGRKIAQAPDWATFLVPLHIIRPL